MKNSIVILFLVAALCCFVSCDNKSYSTGAMGKQKISRSVQLDDGEYVDVTLKDINASIITNSDFNLLCRGTFYHEDGSFIMIDSSSEMCFIHSEKCNTNDENKGKAFDSSFVYKICSASPNVLYLCPLTKSGVMVNINGRPVNSFDIPSFSTYIPLYGFGQNRIEVNPILDGDIALPSGTYWKK